MPPTSPVPASLTARIIHAALVLGVILFCGAAWYAGSHSTIPPSAVPDRRVLYLGLFLISALLFGAAMYSASRLTTPSPGMSQEDWWRVNLGRVVVIWALVETPSLIGMLAYLLTHDFRTLIAPFTGLLFFVNYRPSRLVEG